MKVLVLLILVIAVFFGCAVVGYRLANVQETVQQLEAETEVAALASEQHNIILLRVDQLSAESPRLISVWFVSVFFADNQPSSLTLAQLYPPQKQSILSQVLSQAFSLDANGEPSSAFWYALESYKIQWEGYVMVDTNGAGEALNWLLGPGEHLIQLDAAEKDPNENKRLVDQICVTVVSAKGKDLGTFNWGGLIPEHFRSDLRMETSMAYWARISGAEPPLRCEIILAP